MIKERKKLDFSGFLKIIEEPEISYLGFFLLLTIIVFMRLFLEHILLNHTLIREDIVNAMFYYPLILSIILIFKIYTGEEVKRIISIISRFLWIILLPPILDRFLFERITGYEYIPPGVLIREILSFYNLYPQYVHRGHQITILLTITLCGVYVYYKRKYELKFSFLKAVEGSIGASLFFYFVLGFFASPYLVYYIHGMTPYVIAPNSVKSVEFLRYAIQIYHITLTLILGMILLGYESGSRILWESIKSLTPVRTIHFVLMCVGGAIISSRLTTPVDIVYMLHGAVIIIFFWVFARVINNWYDLELDTYLNKKRFVTHTFVEISIILVLLGEIVSFSISNSVFILYNLLILLAIVYSCPKLNIRRFFMVKNIIIGVASAFAFLLGVYVVGGDINQFILKLASIIAFSFTLGSVINDYSDVLGDKKFGISTLPAKFNSHMAIKIGSLFVLIAMAVPALLLNLSGIVKITVVSLSLIGSGLTYFRKYSLIYLLYFLEYFLIIWYFI